MKSVSWRIKRTSTTTKDYFPSFLFNVSLQTDCQEQLKLFNEFKKGPFSHIIYKIGTGVSLRTCRLEEEFAHVMMCTFLHSTDLFSPYDKTTRVVIILGFWSSLVLLCRMTTPNSVQQNWFTSYSLNKSRIWSFLLLKKTRYFVPIVVDCFVQKVKPRRIWVHGKMRIPKEKKRRAWQLKV